MCPSYMDSEKQEPEAVPLFCFDQTSEAIGGHHVSVATLRESIKSSENRASSRAVWTSLLMGLGNRGRLFRSITHFCSTSQISPSL